MLPTLDAQGLRLVPLGRDDLHWLHGLLTQPGVRRYLCDDRVLELARVERILAENEVWQASTLGMWAIEAEGAKRLGTISLQPVSPEGARLDASLAGEIEPVIALADAHAGKGHGSKALAAALAHAFVTLRLPRLVALADQPNVASHALLTRAGFRVTGLAQGEVHPIRIYELTADEAR